MNVVGLSWDYFVRGLDGKSKGNFEIRQCECAKNLTNLIRIVYSPRSANKNKVITSSNMHIYYTSSISRVFFAIDVIKIIMNIRKKIKIDLITAEDPVFAGIVGILVKYIFKIPLNVQLHYDAIDNPYRLAERKRNYVYNIVTKWVVRRADSIRVPSIELQEKLLSLGINKERIWIIPVGVTVSKFENASGDKIRKYYLRDRFDKIILYVGRLSPEKDIPTLLLAFKEILKNHETTLLLLVGEGKEREHLKVSVKEYGIENNVIFCGPIDYEILPEYYAASDIFVLPSLREGRASVLVEAVLTKKPIVTTNVSGARDCVVDGKTGFIIESQNCKKMVEKIVYLLDNPDVAMQFGKTGYEHFNKNLKEANEVKALIHSWEEATKIKFANQR